MQDNVSENAVPEETETTASEIESFEPISLSTEEAVPSDEGEILPDTDEPLAPVGETEAQPQEETRARRFFRKLIRWTMGLLIIFGLGFLTAIFTIYNPKVDELGQTQNDYDLASGTITGLEDQIDTLQDQIDDLNAQIETLNQEITDLEAQNQDLITQQENFGLQIALLKARADVVNAQVELYDQNPAQARVLLESTRQSLETIETLLPDDLKDVVTPLQNRLELAIGEIETDPETAIADLGILAGDLLEIENALFGD